MPNRLILKPFAMLAALVLVLAALASVCPTCDTGAHGSGASPNGAGEAGPLVNDWQPSDAGCACCETNRCAENEELPDGLLHRAPPVVPILLAAAGATVLPSADTSAREGPGPRGPIPERTKVHIRHATFLC